VSCLIVPLKGNGEVAQFEKTVAAFEGIDITGSGDVFFHKSDVFRVSVAIDSNLEAYTDVEVIGGILHIGTKRGRHVMPTQFTVDVYCPTLAGVTISGSATFAGRDTIRGPRFRTVISGSGSMEADVQCDDYAVHISGSGNISAAIQCESFTANISGSGTITASGSGKRADITVTGSGAVNGNNFNVDTAGLTVTGSGAIHLGVSEYLNAVTTGSGSIRYRGNPKIDYKNSGAGTIASE
jgi:hypothetical protein